MTTDFKMLSDKEIARMVRDTLKEKFDDIKFSVRLKSTGSINVTYMGGPSSEDVEAAVKMFEGSGFDGTIDYAFNKFLWMTPEGKPICSGHNGTDSTGGIYTPHNEKPPQPDAVKWHMGSTYIFVTRENDPNGEKDFGGFKGGERVTLNWTGAEGRLATGALLRPTAHGKWRVYVDNEHIQAIGRQLVEVHFNELSVNGRR